LLQDKVSKEAEQHPQILYGHSMGGNIILNYLLRNGQSSFQAAVCTSPWLRLAFDPPAIKLWLGRMVQGIWPSYSEKNTLDTGLLARDPAVAADYEADPLVHGVITARAFNEVHQAGIYALENRSKLGTQTLLMHGSADGIADFKSSKEFAQGLQQVEFVPWDGYYHELHNEPEKEEIFDRVLAWLDNQLSN
jgi:alpha-beta hydrolase superfamily lysophospholipase